MNRMTPAELKRKATDIFSFILLSCPDFPAETETTTAREFDELTELIHAVMEGTHSEDGKQWLRISLQEVQQSRKHYEKGDRKEGRYVIQRAEEHFKNAFAQEKTDPRFVAEESGAAQDTDTGFPS